MALWKIYITLSWTTCAVSQNKNTVASSGVSRSCASLPPRDYSSSLVEPNGLQMAARAPDAFDLLFGTTAYGGGFTAQCARSRAPVWVDRIFNLALNGYYDDNFFFRVIESSSLHAVQFGTGGDPTTSAPYNFQGEPCLSGGPGSVGCGILLPQPDTMPIGDDEALSNVFGTLGLSTNWNELTNTTWNATAELFVNTGDNSRLDDMLFVPVCTIDSAGMNNILSFPSFGEVEELGGPGPSLSKLYSEGNAYIEANSKWASMAQTSRVRVSCSSQSAATSSPPSSAAEARSPTAAPFSRGLAKQQVFSSKLTDHLSASFNRTCGPCALSIVDPRTQQLPGPPPPPAAAANADAGTAGDVVKVARAEGAGAGFEGDKQSAAVATMPVPLIEAGLRYLGFSTTEGKWLCPPATTDTCFGP